MIKRILSTSFYSVVSRFFITSTNLFVVFFVSKNLGRVELGNYGIVFFFFIFFNSISSFSLYQFFGKEFAKCDRGSREEEDILNEFLVVSLLGLLLVFIFPIIISLFYKKISLTLLTLSAVAGYLLGLERNLGGILLGRERMPIESLANFFSFSVVVLPMVFSSVYFISIERIFYLRVLALIIIVIFKFWFIRDYFKSFRITLKLRKFREGKFHWFSGLSSLTVREVDVLILSFFIDRSLLGAYFLAIRIYYAFGMLAEVVSSGLTPFISRTYNGKEKNGFRKFNTDILLIFLFFALIFSVSLFFSRNLIISIFSPEFINSSGRYLFYLSFILFFRFFSYFTGSILTSTEFQNIRFYITFSASVLLIGLEIILGSQFKVAGIIISRAIVELFIFFTIGYFVKRILNEYKLKVESGRK